MGGLLFDKDGKIIGHKNSPDRLTKESIEFWEREENIELRCSICYKRLEPGDQKDHFWPYFDEMNRCKKCLEEESK